MTTYAAFASSSGQDLNSLTVFSVSSPIRLARVEVKNPFNNGGGQTVVQFLRYSGAGSTGGTAVTPAALREPAPNALATSRFNATISGTGTSLEYVPVGASGAGIGGVTYQPPFDLLASPGSAFRAVVTSSAGTPYAASLAIYFEELRQLSWPL